MTDLESPTAPSNARYRSTLWTRAHRVTTVGMVLVVTLIAFEFMGVATALPTLVADLHGGRFYGWPIAAFTAASAVGTVVSGRICDRRGPAGPLLGAIALFTVGLVIDGMATSMPVLLAGRVVQGIGAGAVVVAVYVLIAVVYPQRDRPAASALLAAAWVLPALVGPAAAGLVTERFGWRWVFLGLVPLVAVGSLLLIPVARRLPAAQPDPTRPVRRGVLLAGVGAAVGVAALTLAAQSLSWAMLPVGVAGLVITAFALRELLPRGTLRAGRGLPSVVLSRGLLAGGFNAVEAYVPLALTAVHGYSPAAAGLPLTVGALGWSAASAWQGRYPDVPRGTLLRVAFCLTALGLAGMAAVSLHATPGWLAMPVWAVAGAGMGLGIPSIAVLQLQLSPADERGFTSSAVQLSDMIGTVLLVGIGGVLINTLASTARPEVALIPLDLLMCAILAFGASLPAGRTMTAP